MTDILIRTKKKNIEHKMESENIDSAWWTVGALPTKIINKVLFTDGERVIAEGKPWGWIR